MRLDADRCGVSSIEGAVDRLVLSLLARRLRRRCRFGAARGVYHVDDQCMRVVHARLQLTICASSHVYGDVVFSDNHGRSVSESVGAALAATLRCDLLSNRLRGTICEIWGARRDGGNGARSGTCQGGLWNVGAEAMMGAGGNDEGCRCRGALIKSCARCWREERESRERRENEVSEQRSESRKGKRDRSETSDNKKEREASDGSNGEISSSQSINAQPPGHMSLVGNFFWNASGGRIFRTDVERGRPGRCETAKRGCVAGDRSDESPFPGEATTRRRPANGAARATRERSICRSPGWRADCASATSDPG
ncbi:hypothetical protein BDY17DRAFT_79200 [Neohortaea acidophila]|uniref:Uncharacterized protein n=1 Tax=Neohortaea acidophila TaxID=245834 RepID=A0A6A6Q358_9PEZI|nr:uncharacterized protein BDY17DRAFT_79200 [Neohortaea acidophila]KAF2486439.1 hypothetical protein BDY17DRAFT_79200 [Neohortaea acidophila]